MTVTLLNDILNWVKVGLIQTTDVINKVGNPYDQFDRPAQPKYAEPLHVKERKFTGDMQSFFWPEHGIWRYKLPTDPGDQCLWHGIYTTMLALKHSVTGTHLPPLTSAVQAMEKFLGHRRLGGRYLIRGWREDGTFQQDVSNDQASGFVCGVYFAWKYGDLTCREHARNLILGIADELAIHGNQLINEDGQPTKHGKLENGYLTDPLNLTLCLVTYLIAHRITGESIYRLRYDELVRKYRPLIPYANVRLLWWEKTHHAHRAAIHYSILAELERDHDLNRLYVKGLLRTWTMERRSGNPWIYYLMRRVVLFDPSHIDACRKHLTEFTLEDKQHNAERINSDKVDTFKWGKHRRVRQPLPRWRVGSQDFFWQRHLYSADDWVGHGAGDVRHNGGDFLIAYWGLRSLRLIGADE